MSAVIPDTTDLNLSKYVELRPYEPVEAHPFIRGRRIPIYLLAHTAQARNLSVKELAYEYSLSENEVLAGLLFYAENQAEIDAQEAEIQQHYQPMFEEGRKRWEEMKARRKNTADQP